MKKTLAILLTITLFAMTGCLEEDGDLTNPKNDSVPGLPYISNVIAGAFGKIKVGWEGYAHAYVEFENRVELYSDENPETVLAFHESEEEVGSIIFEGLEVGKTYKVRVRSSNSYGSGEWNIADGEFVPKGEITGTAWIEDFDPDNVDGYTRTTDVVLKNDFENATWIRIWDHSNKNNLIAEVEADKTNFIELSTGDGEKQFWIEAWDGITETSAIEASIILDTVAELGNVIVSLDNNSNNSTTGFVSTYDLGYGFGHAYMVKIEVGLWRIHGYSFDYFTERTKWMTLEKPHVINWFANLDNDPNKHIIYFKDEAGNEGSELIDIN